MAATPHRRVGTEGSLKTIGLRESDFNLWRERENMLLALTKAQSKQIPCVKDRCVLMHMAHLGLGGKSRLFRLPLLQRRIVQFLGTATSEK